MTKDKGAVVTKGGGNVWYKEVNDDGSDLGTPDSFADLGYIESWDLQDDTEREETYDEAGELVKSEEMDRTIKITGNLMQSDKATLDFLKETVRGNFYAVYRYEGIVNGKYQEALFGICQFKPMVGLASGTKRPPIEITVLKNESALTSVDISGVTGNHASTITVPAGEYYAFAETSV